MPSLAPARFWDTFSLVSVARSDKSSVQRPVKRDEQNPPAKSGDKDSDLWINISPMIVDNAAPTDATTPTETPTPTPTVHYANIMDWFVQRRKMELSLPAVLRYRDLPSSFQVVTSVQDWSFTSAWEIAVLNVPESVLKVFRPDDDYDNPAFVSFIWNTLNYGDCHERAR